MTCVLSCRRKGWRARHVHPHNRATRAPASSNRQMLSHTFSPRAQATPPPVVGLIHNRSPAAAASLNIVITVTTRIERVAQNTLTFSFRTTEERVWHAHSRCRTTRAPASSNRRMPNSIRPMPSRAFSPRVDAAPPPAAGSVHNGAPAAPASLSSLSTVVIVTIAIVQSQSRSLPRSRTIGPRVHTVPPPASPPAPPLALPLTPGLKRSSGPILWSTTTEGSRTRVLSCCRGHRRFGQACRGCRSRAATYLSRLMPSHPYSRPPAQTRPMVLVIEGAAVPLKTASQSTARTTILPSHRANVAGHVVHPPPPAEQHPSRRPADITQARLEGEQSST